jgi:hypothetical protein
VIKLALWYQDNEGLFGPIFYDAPPNSQEPDEISQLCEWYTQPEDGERQSYEQLVDVDEPHAE